MQTQVAGNMYRSLVFIVMVTVLALSCKKEDPSANMNIDGLDRPYCNDPDAINYNQTFPGKPDNSICYFPTQPFKGSFLFKDSIYDADNKFRKAQELQITLSATSSTKMEMFGFCGGSEPLKITADRYYKATMDSTIVLVNNIEYNLYGQYLCRTSDTISGYLLKDKVDSNKLTFFFTVASDSGASYHKGTGIRQ